VAAAILALSLSHPRNRRASSDGIRPAAARQSASVWRRELSTRERSEPRTVKLLELPLVRRVVPLELSTTATMRFRSRLYSRKIRDQLGEVKCGVVRHARHRDRLFDEAGLGAAPARRRLRRMARDAPGAARNARQQLIDTGWDAPILGRIVELIDERARWLLDLTAGTA
jgi:hypothetical protein